MFEALSAREWRTERFELARVEQPEDAPPPDPRVIDVALLDMHHGFANVGHDSIVALVRDAALASDDALARARRRVIRRAGIERRAQLEHNSPSSAPGWRNW